MTEKDYKTALRMITYERIHHLRDVEHRSIQRIADDLGLNFRTVKKYLGMSREEFEAFTNSIIQKPFVLEPYKEFIVQRLSLYPDTSAAQMHDRLKENYPKLPALSPKTIYNYVMKLRSDYIAPEYAQTRASALEVIILPLVKCIMDRSIFVCYLRISGCWSLFVAEWL